MTRGIFLFYYEYMEKSVTKNKKNLSLVLICSVFTALFIFFGLILLNRQAIVLLGIKKDIHQELELLKTSQVSNKDNLNKQLVLLREELIKYKSQQEGRDQILGLATINQNQKIQNQATAGANMPVPTVSAVTEIKGIVQLKKNWQTADVFETPKASSKIVGQIIRDKIYFIFAKEDGWFKIDYKLSERGWVQASLIDEF